jgi:hypothetical protein
MPSPTRPQNAGKQGGGMITGNNHSMSDDRESAKPDLSAARRTQSASPGTSGPQTKSVGEPRGNHANPGKGPSNAHAVHNTTPSSRGNVGKPHGGLYEAMAAQADKLHPAGR